MWHILIMGKTWTNTRMHLVEGLVTETAVNTTVDAIEPKTEHKERFLCRVQGWIAPLWCKLLWLIEIKFLTNKHEHIHM
jgi:hypothetical protein